MEEFDVTTFPEGYQEVIEKELEFLPEEEREGYMFGLMCFLITC